MKIEVLPSAFSDLKKGREFYQIQSNNLGEYFFDSLFSDIDSLILHAGVHQKYFDYYRKLSNTFPYAIYYKVENRNEIIIYRVLDCRQNPEKTTKQLSK